MQHLEDSFGRKIIVGGFQDFDGKLARGIVAITHGETLFPPIVVTPKKSKASGASQLNGSLDPISVELDAKSVNLVM